jgi:hypothetical protein
MLESRFVERKEIATRAKEQGGRYGNAQLQDRMTAILRLSEMSDAQR